MQGRGEFQLAVLVELMRREGFELTVGKPQVVTREVDGKIYEPVERLAIDAPEDYVGVITHCSRSAKAARAHGQSRHRLGAHGVPRACARPDRLPHRVPHRDPRHGILHHVFHDYEPWHGELRMRPTGSLVADRRGPATGFALLNLQERGQLFIAPGTEVYEGMVVGENAAPRSRRQRDQGEEAHQHALVHRGRAGQVDSAAFLSLEQSLEFLGDDECVEVTPSNVRLRKAELSAQKRATATSRKAVADSRRSSGLPLRAPAAAARVHQLRPCRLQAGFLELGVMTKPAGDVTRLGLLFGQTNVIALPLRPARPVRPVRCT